MATSGEKEGETQTCEAESRKRPLALRATLCNLATSSTLQPTLLVRRSERAHLDEPSLYSIDVNHASEDYLSTHVQPSFRNKKAPSPSSSGCAWCFMVQPETAVALSKLKYHFGANGESLMPQARTESGPSKINMDPGATNLALQISPQTPSISGKTTLTEAVQADWKSVYSLVGDDVKRFFEARACDDLAGYLGKIEEACQQHRDESYGFKVIDWFQPIFKAVELFMPAAQAAVQAHPNPGSLILGGIVAVLQITTRVVSYHKLTLQMLARMGMKAQILLAYEREVYKENYPVQKALIQVYGDIAAFLQKGFRFLTEGGRVRAKVRGIKLLLFNDYESQLGQEVEKFEHHMEDLEGKALLCDKKRLKELHDDQEAHHREFGQMAAELRGHFQRHDDSQQMLVDLWEREQILREQMERRRREKDKLRSLDWLSSENFRAPYEQRCREHLDGTGSWLIESDTYKIWKSSGDSDLLWVSGKPGCGKSVLAAVTVTNLNWETGPDVALAYAFCRRENESSQSPSTIFDSLVRQICQKRLDINQELESAFLKGEKPTPSIVRAILNSALEHLRKTYILIDALDECKDNGQLLLDLLELIQDKVACPVKIIIFSRHEWPLEDSLGNYKQLRPDNGANTDDLRAYIESLFPDGTDGSVSVNQEIREECIAKADGMFLWVKLLQQSLQKPLLSKQKLKRIRAIPPGLDSMYDRLLKDIWAQDEDVRSIAFRVLIWVTHAQRPLSRSEMLEAVADYSEITTLKELEQHKHTNPELLVAICANLVFIDKDGYFRLCHETVRAYLEDIKVDPSVPLAEYQRQKHDAHKFLAEICLNYLMLKDFDCGPANSLGRLKSLVKKSPFVAYAAEFWGSHVEEDNARLLGDLISRFVQSSARRELSIQIYLYNPAEDSDLWKCIGSSNPLHVLSIFGLRQASEALPDYVTLSQEADGSGATPLTYALIGKHHEMSLWLIEGARNSDGLTLDATQRTAAIHLAASLGWADVLENLVCDDEQYVNSLKGGMTPLVTACKAGHEDAAEILIRAKANVDMKDGDGDSPLIVATINGHQKLVKILLDNGADPNCHDRDGITPLHFAALDDHVAIAKALLAKGGNPIATVPSGDEETPFHLAAQCGSLGVVKELHSVHPALDMKTKGSGSTVLHIAAWNNSSLVAKVLLELGAPKDDVDNEKRTALFIAAQEGALDTVKILIDARCDVNLANSTDKTVICAAAGSGKLAVTRYIIRSQPIENWKALVSKRSESGENSLHAAICGGNTEIVRFLLKAGADATTNGVLESSPLHYAVHYGHKAMIRPILDQTKDANPRNTEFDTPLHFAARARRLDVIVQFFQDCTDLGLSIDIEARNKFQKTAFVIALGKACKEVAEYLLENGATSVLDDDGNYPIHLAAWYGFDSIVEALLTQDGVSSQGYYGRTPLFCAAFRGQLKTLKILAQNSKEMLNVRDKAQMAPVAAALSNGHFEVTNFLLDMQADHTVEDEDGTTLLHIAANVGDLPMVERLLKLGCRGDATNRYKTTPFHRAVEANSVEIVDALIAGGFNAVDIRDATGDLCSMIAAEQGNLEMFQKLTIPGGQYGSCNLLGRTTALLAASSGQWEILDFLEKHAGRQESPDLEGYTPLMLAAAEGYPDTVKYILQTQTQNVNQFNIWANESALSEAARRIHPLTIKYLLAAGADPYHRDASGLNALDFAARHSPSLREMHKAGHFHDPRSLKVQGQILLHTIRQSCKNVLLLSRELSVAELFHRLISIDILAKALIRIQDYSAAQVCIMELCWHSKTDDIRSDFTCAICGFKYFDGDKYICKSCHSLTILCQKCHEEYENSGRAAPEALIEIMEIEKFVQPVRNATPEGLSLLNVYFTMRYFEAGVRWISMVLDAYETWEQKHNSTDVYRALQRPGQQLLKMITELDRLMNKIFRGGEADPEDRKNIAKLNHKYQVHRKRHRSDKEIADFICKDHDFFIVSADEHKTTKAAGQDLDPESGKVSGTFLQRLLDNYGDGSDQQPNGADHDSCQWPPRSPARAEDTSIGYHPSRAVVGTKVAIKDESRPQILKRSQTSYTRKPTKRHSRELSWPGPGRKETTTNLFPLLPNRGATKARRVQTLPIPSKEKQGPQVENLEVEMKDTRSLAAMRALLDPIDESQAPAFPDSNQPQPTLKRTISVTVLDAPDSVEGPAVLPSTAEGDEASQIASPEEPMLALTLSSEPDSIVEKGAVSLIQSHEKAATTNTIATDTESDTLDPNLRYIYLLVENDINTDDEDAAMWLLALIITDAMMPGFRECYVQAKIEEREAEEELEKEESENEELEKSTNGNEDDDDDDLYNDAKDAR